jgi:dihydroxyacetone kinase
VGDGDCGSTLAKGAAAVQQQLPALPLDDAAAAALQLGRTLGRACGGTSGAVVRARRRFLVGEHAAEEINISLLPA